MEEHRPIARLTDEELKKVKQEIDKDLKLARLTGIYNVDRLSEIRETTRE